MELQQNLIVLTFSAQNAGNHVGQEVHIELQAIIGYIINAKN
jgi:hypothetical protein